MGQKCKEKVWNGYSSIRCSRNAVRDGFCKQHHPDAVKQRQQQQSERWERKMSNSPIARLQKRIDELEKENKELKAKISHMETQMLEES